MTLSMTTLSIKMHSKITLRAVALSIKKLKIKILSMKDFNKETQNREIY
jgi:hypothetical protein